jgi:hypothetical protein
MFEFTTPTRLFVATAEGLLATVNLPMVSHQPLSPGWDDQQANTGFRPFPSAGEHAPTQGSTTDLAILINPLGEITAPDFYRVATPDRLWGHWANICRLLGADQPLGIGLPACPGLVAWIARQGDLREGDVNMTASMLLRTQCSAPGPLVHGPLLITGGMPRRPVALTSDQVTEALDDLLGIGLDDEDGEIF